MPTDKVLADTSIVADLLDPEFMRKLEQLAVISRKVFPGRMKGERRSRKKGVSVEFADYRDYVVGDDLRFVDWNIYGRLDRLFLKLFLEEEDLFVHLIVDTSRSMDFGEPSKFAFARRLAAALGYVGLVNLDRVGVGGVAGGGSTALQPVRGRASLWKLARFLSGLQPEGGTDLAESVRRYFVRNPGRGVAILLTDLMDPAGYEPALKQLLRHRLDITVLHILSPEEVDPPLSGDLRLVDVETGDATEVTANEKVLALYRANLNSYIGRAKRYAKDRGMLYFFAQSDLPFEQLILSYLRRGGLLR